MTPTREASLKIMEAHEYAKVSIDQINNRFRELEAELKSLDEPRDSYWHFTLQEHVELVKIAYAAESLSVMLKDRLRIITLMSKLGDPAYSEDALRAELRKLDKKNDNS